MKSRMVAIVLAGLLLGADTKDAKKDTELLQGTWQVTELVRNGEAAPKDDVAKAQLVIKEDKFTFKANDGTHEGSFKIDPSTKPKNINVITPGGETLKGIYSVTDKEYKLCVSFGGERPKDFSSKADSGCMLLVMKKDK